MYDYSKLKLKLYELNMTQKEYAEKLGITEQCLNTRFNNKTDFKRNEMKLTMDLFGEPIENICYYFFTKKV